MGLQFLLGRSGTGTSTQIVDEISEKLLKAPQGPPIFYIVPDQMTFQQESALFNGQEIKGSIRAQVFSFSRLAWRVLQETGGGTKQFISSIGIQMMLRKIIEEKKTDWYAFQKAMEKQGFLKQLESMITEFKRYDVTPEALNMQKMQIDQYAHKEAGEAALSNKLADLYYVYEQLQIALQGKYIDSEDQLGLLTEQIENVALLEDAEVYFDGFYRFTPKELRVVEALMKKCKQVTICLTVDQADTAISELDLFYQTKETYGVLKEIAHANNIKIEGQTTLSPAVGNFKDKPYFSHLEQYFDTRPAPIFKGEVPIQIAEAVHPRAEIEGVAQEIKRLVQEENYRYRDIVLFTRQTNIYHDLIQTIFQDYEIPVFMDEKQLMLNHSLIEFIRSLLDVIKGNWRYDAVFRVLKTGFIPVADETYPLTLDAIDELENYVLEYGVRGKERWFSTDPWIFQRFRGFDKAAQTSIEKETELRINAYRAQIIKVLHPFDEKIREAKTVQDFCEVIYLLLEEMEVPARLENLRAVYDETGEIEKGREQEQVWAAVIQLFDELVEIAGSEPMSLKVFDATINSGFESLEFAHVPPSMDHIIVGTIDRSRISSKKAAFLIGVNDGIWPLKPNADGMINEQERELLAIHGLQLAETSKRQLLDDWFYMYLAFTSATDYLWVSYPLSDEEGKSKIPSQLINRVEALFPASGKRLLLQDPDELYDADRFITTPVKTRSALTAQLARQQKGYGIKPIWNEVLNWYIKNEAKYSTTYNVLQSLYYQNEPTNLSEATAKRIYPKTIKASVSRLEMYHRCSYQHFAAYSLKLTERKTYHLDAPDIGLLFHEALKRITESIQAEGRNFADLKKEETNQYARKAVTKLAPILQHQILHSSNRYKYIQQKLEEVIARAVYVLSEQARLSKFSPVGLEIGFGDNETLNPVVVPLPNGFELLLRGRIDRVDKATDSDQLLLRIIDYKSSKKGLNLVEVYYGLALQMLTYLDVVLNQSEAWLGMHAEPAGVLYFHVHNPMIQIQEFMKDTQIEEEIFKKYKMQGLLVSDENIVKLMDTTLETGTSQIIPAGMKKDGSFNARSKVADKDSFTHLQAHMHRLMVQAGIHMTSGDVQLNPYEHKQNIACTHCAFHSVCQFDPTLEQNNYHKLTDMKDEQILLKLRDLGDING